VAPVHGHTTKPGWTPESTQNTVCQWYCFWPSLVFIYWVLSSLTVWKIYFVTCCLLTLWICKMWWHYHTLYWNPWQWNELAYHYLNCFLCLCKLSQFIEFCRCILTWIISKYCRVQSISLLVHTIFVRESDNGFEIKKKWKEKRNA